MDGIFTNNMIVNMLREVLVLPNSIDNFFKKMFNQVGISSMIECHNEGYRTSSYASREIPVIT